jgi:hypothetical protein
MMQRQWRRHGRRGGHQWWDHGERSKGELEVNGGGEVEEEDAASAELPSGHPYQPSS